MTGVFEEIKQGDRERQEFLKQRNEEIRRIKRMRDPERKRRRDLKEKANKARKWIKSAGFKDFEDYLMDLTIQAEISLRALGLNGKSSTEIGDKAIRLAERLNVLETIISDPKDLIKMMEE